MDLNTLTDKKKETKPVDEDRWYLGDGVSRVVEGGTSYLIVKVAGFPESKWNEWDKDCKENFSNCRWAKMMDDHTKAKMLSLVLDNKFGIKAEQKKEEPKEEICIGGEKIE